MVPWPSRMKSALRHPPVDLTLRSHTTIKAQSMQASISLRCVRLSYSRNMAGSHTTLICHSARAHPDSRNDSVGEVEAVPVGEVIDDGRPACAPRFRASQTAPH